MLHAALLWGDFSLCLIGCAEWYCESSFLDNIFFFFNGIFFFSPCPSPRPQDQARL